MIATMNVRGRVGVVMPHGVLFRGGAEGEIRAGFVKEDLIEAVIGLGPNLFYGAGIPAAILVLNRAKLPERRGKILFVHGAEQMIPGSTQQNTLSEEHIATLVRVYRSFTDEPRLARVVTNEEVAAAGFSCNIASYVDLSRESALPDINTVLRALQSATSKRDETEMRMQDLLRKLGYGSL
jgi:type I restriction enzyme M protein